MNSLIIATFVLALVLITEKIENTLGDLNKKDTNITMEEFKNEKQ